MITEKVKIGKFTKAYCRIRPHSSDTITIILINQRFLIFRWQESHLSVERKTGECDDEVVSRAFKRAEDWLKQISAFHSGIENLSAAIKRGNSITQRLKEM